MGRVLLAAAAAGLFTIALLTVLGGEVSKLTLLATFGGLIAMSLTLLALVNDRLPR